MSVPLNSIYKLRPSVAVANQGKYVDFFLTDIRKNVCIEIGSDVQRAIYNFDGVRTLEEWFHYNAIAECSYESAFKLIDYLNNQHILILVDEAYSEQYSLFPRIFSMLENFFCSQSDINKAFKRMQTKKVMVIGMGSVGTWVTHSLAMSGILNFIIVDADKVEVSNLHRQFGFTESEIGEYKVSTVKRFLMRKNKDCKISCISENLTENALNEWDLSDVDLIINCADSPSVDATSQWVGKYCMEHSIPHIIGGGYNLHLSLIGQVVIPGVTACVECFRKNLEEINIIDTTNIRRLESSNRRVGSFPPLSAISASIASNEAFKLLAGLNNLSMVNLRTEFSLESMNFKSISMSRRGDCKWCGYEGTYYQLSKYSD